MKKTVIAGVLLLSMLDCADADAAWICRTGYTSVEDDDPRYVEYCHKRFPRIFPSPGFTGAGPTFGVRPAPAPPSSPSPSFSPSPSNQFDTNHDGKLDCWKHIVGPAGKRSTTHVSSPYGYSRWRSGNWHHGVDIVSRTANFGLGQPVRAIADGVVSHAGTTDTNGNFVQVTHRDGHASRYLHLRDIHRRDGEIRAGDVLGSMNCTGHCGPPGQRNRVQSTHVHLELLTHPGAPRTHEGRPDPLSYLGSCDR